MKASLGPNLEIDVDRLLVSRLLVQANSGGGKSWALRPLVLAGNSHMRWRQGIGNAVPPDAAESMAEQMLLTLLLGELGVFTLSNNEVWVAPERRALIA